MRIPDCSVVLMAIIAVLLAFILFSGIWQYGHFEGVAFYRVNRITGSVQVFYANHPDAHWHSLGRD